LEYRDTNRSISVIEKEKKKKKDEVLETLVEKTVETKNYAQILEHWFLEVK